MTLRMPGVSYLGPPDSNWGGTVARPPTGMVVHIAEGSYQGTIAWQRNSSADVSSFFVVSRAGDIAQMLDLDLMAWTQGSGNPAWIGVENEGFSTDGFTDAQVNANARIFAWLRSVWPSIASQVSNSPNVGGLGWHGMGGAPWGNHPGCPGAVNVALLPVILARALGGVDPSPGPFPPAVDLRPRRNVVFRLIDPEGAQFVISPDTLSPTGWSYQTIADPVGAQGRMIEASGMGTVNGNLADPNHGQHANGDWRPGAFGPSKAAVRQKLVDDIAAKVLAGLPASGGGLGPSLAQIQGAVRTELDATKLGH